MSKTLLLADDSVTIQKVVSISFASEDVKLVTVDNGDDAIAKAREVRPDLILADVVMPGKSGYEVCEAIKADPGLRHVPVLLLTGTFEAFDEERAGQAGAAGHIAKPFEAQALVQRVKELLASSVAPPPAPAPAAAAAEPMASAEPAPEAPASEDAFDFFDDDADDLAGSDPIVTAEPAEADELDFEGPDAAFAFGAAEAEDDDEPLAFEAPDERWSVAESTVAILPDADPLATPPTAADAPEPTVGESDLAAFEAPPLADKLLGEAQAARSDDTAPEPLAPIEPAAAGEAFDFDLDESPAAGESPLRVDSDDLAQATVLDPLGASGYDVSSSDLGDPLGAAPPEPSFEPPRSEPEPLVDATPAPEPSRPTSELPPLDELAPQLREQLHDTLEKIAWESFSDVTEKIVRQALERVEAIAWEVIPQLAEALIREEIRRMKGE